MAKKAVSKRKAPQAPINPMTGSPNAWEGGAAGAGAPRPCGDGAASRVVVAGSPPAAAGCEAVGSDAASSSGQVAAVAASGDHIEDAFEKLKVFFDSRVVALVVLAVLLFELVGIGNIVVLLFCYLVGYILVDRFINVRRSVVMGGIAWESLLLLGHVVRRTAGPLFLDIDYFFMFCGFFLALAVCGTFFAGRAMFMYGQRRGREQADEVIARHVVDRLVDHRDSWDHLDGDYLEVEGAINRVRARERQSDQALRDEARRKDDLVTYLAHDLKTPLASVVGYLSLLEEAPDLPAEQRVRFTGVALEKAHRLDALIEEFFDITRFDFHDIVLTRGYIDLALMLAQVADEFYPILSEQGKRAEIDVPDGLTVLVDGDKMARVFNNVMKNAIAYSYEGSTIRVFAERRSDGTVRISFENRGDPIPEPKLKVIFEKFYRLDAARATNRGGAGLGLAIAKEIVCAHDGAISCISTPEHTVFSIDLPA